MLIRTIKGRKSIFVCLNFDNGRIWDRYMKIKILNVNDKINDEKEQPFEEKSIINGTILLSDNFYSADKEHKLIVKQDAVKEIFEFIKWDMGKLPETRVEQGGILLGKRFFDSSKNVHYTIVSKVITADTANGSSAFLEITPECWSAMHDKKDNYIEESGEKIIIVGWFHTHPNMLPVFMSETDKNTQKLFFNGDNTYSLVINPQRHLIKAFRAAPCFPTQAFLLISEMFNTGE